MTSQNQKSTGAFLYRMLPILSPESYLTEDEIKELLESLNGKNNYISLKLNSKCEADLLYNSDKKTFSIALSVR